MNWKEIKQQGSGHYKTGDVEPIDLFKSGGILWDKVIADIIKYAYRNRRELKEPVRLKDIEKIKHCADMLNVFAETPSEWRNVSVGEGNMTYKLPTDDIVIKEKEVIKHDA
ncbi:MAG: DUF3310 domain-containing protein [Acidobacteriota bacterium]|nr:DUF3310 domain-containing protein [Acidobacteriota bacterium]